MSVDLVLLKAEIDTDTLGRGYAGMTDDQVAEDLNTEYRLRDRTAMSGDEMFNATDSGEFNALDSGSGNTADDQAHWLSFCGRDQIDPFGSANVQFVIDLFGAGSTTVTNLNNLRRESISRAVELFNESVTTADVIQARAL